MIKNPSSSINEVFKNYVNFPKCNKIPEKKSEPKILYNPLILCGPSGSGKTTLLKILMDDFKDYFGFSVSHTTRKPRKGEIDGRDYHFVDRDTMNLLIKEGKFIETAEFSGNIYGTSKKSVIHVQKMGKICILDVDIKGVQSLKNTDLKPKCIFIRPPNFEILEKRLRQRGTETEETIKKRLIRAVEETEIGKCKKTWDHLIINDDLNQAYEQLKMFIKQVYTI